MVLDEVYNTNWCCLDRYWEPYIRGGFCQKLQDWGVDLKVFKVGGPMK